MHSILYEFCRDQGGVIGGVLALIAGIVAYCGALHAAKMQVTAVNAQTETVNRQNTELKNESRRKLARKEIIAGNLLDGVLSRINDDIISLNIWLAKKLSDGVNHFSMSDFGNPIVKPTLTIVWNNLGMCGTEVIREIFTVGH